MADQNLTAQDFHVGWICALDIEYTAARMMRDEKLDPDISLENDDNSYSYGRIGKHHVVIACLPDGMMGKASAASVAKDMLRSFPNIRFGLMVGIGGGAPTRTRDIRLGDVVVSKPDGMHGGVVQYDFGKENQSTGFTRTSSLNNPPRQLLTAVSTLKAEHREDGPVHMLESVQTLTKQRRIGSQFERPPQDLLFVSSFEHIGDDCDTSCAQHADKLVSRIERNLVEDFTKIHYGNIASADKVVKDAHFRDRLAAQEGILCFEMEAAGLMNTFPCIVIRGICDYSDSHKNKVWQPYASGVAAAYAKNLLRVIRAADVKGLPTANEKMGNTVNIATYNDHSTRFRSGGAQFFNRGNVGNQVETQTVNGNMTFNQ